MSLASLSLGAVHENSFADLPGLGILLSILLRCTHDVDFTSGQVVLELHVPTLQAVCLPWSEGHRADQIDKDRETRRHGTIQRLQLAWAEIHELEADGGLADLDVDGVRSEQRRAVLVQFSFACISEDLAQQHIRLVLDGGTLAGLAHTHGVGPPLDVPRADASHRLVA